ncbi:hypothetical protein POSPLADRAFT_1044853 [Postia placenta MAD-698-R-SB12]|uniref:Uncharacterized protein n=1 Tax=Postia placenta MAD-698-R-SB12 TaxID=670580 RepID=A0A1X6NA18_9APHY|nr:hypothetical protein POSPLADRAFT_1044853 [Postia placenta MAD-698-R-SB12]OSX65498.1 hypothetical protein POSPLADRAFT_1044853 [Postia placenta MAD-698-R-SB12]
MAHGAGKVAERPVRNNNHGSKQKSGCTRRYSPAFAPRRVRRGHNRERTSKSLRDPYETHASRVSGPYMRASLAL